MTVYVDDMKAQFRRMIMCHMIAAEEDELHTMAAAIGVARRWYQGDHYDIALTKRAQAVARGAVEITWKQCGCMVMKKRVTGAMGDPADAVEWATAHLAAKRVARDAAAAAAAPNETTRSPGQSA